MSYSLEFHPKALKEWAKLDSAIKEQFKKKLKERLETPKIQKDKLRGFDDVYKIRLKRAGYRLAYRVVDKKLIVLVLKIGKRDTIYNELNKI